MRTLFATVRQSFRHLRWYEASEYSLLMILAVAIPIQWRIALWCLVLLCANTIIKTICRIRETYAFNRQWRLTLNPNLGKPIRICLWMMILYYLAYVISCLYSSQPHEAFSTVASMLPLLLFPLIFLLSDTHYLRHHHLTTLTCLRAATLTLRFAIMLIRSAFHTADSQLFTCTTGAFASFLVQAASLFSQITPFQGVNDTLALQPIRVVAHLFNNTPFERLGEHQFDTLHHNYLSLYILTAIALLYYELIRHWRSSRWRKARWLVVADIAALSVYILLSDSRSGIVAWALLAAACLIHLAVKLKQRRTIGIILVSSALLIGLSYWASPKTYQRITDTAKDLFSGERGDVRQTLWQSGLETIKDRPIFGYGCDGYWDTLFQHYRTNDCLDAEIQQFSTHNQYLETTLATGIIGLIVMLSMILLPVILALRRPYQNLPMILFTIVYAACIFFEATFGRQMGLLFIGFWYCIILHYSNQP